MATVASNGTAMMIAADHEATSHANAISVYSKIADPMDFVEKMGMVFYKSGAGGVKSESEGKMMAFACLCEQKNPFELNRKFHLIEGKLSMRADAMLADFRQRGGKHRWIHDGNDSKEARCEFKFDNQTQEVSFTMDEAQRAGYVRKGSAWEKDPGSMLRARVISRAIRMIAPEIVAGYYTPEEIEDVATVDGTATILPPAQLSPAEREVRRKELLAATDAVADKGDPAGDVIDAEFEAKVETKAEEPPFDVAASTAATATAPATAPADPEAHASNCNVLEIQSLLPKLGTTREALENMLRAKNPAFTKLEDLSADASGKLLENLKAKIAKK